MWTIYTIRYGVSKNAFILSRLWIWKAWLAIKNWLFYWHSGQWTASCYFYLIANKKAIFCLSPAHWFEASRVLCTFTIFVLSTDNRRTSSLFSRDGTECMFPFASNQFGFIGEDCFNSQRATTWRTSLCRFDRRRRQREITARAKAHRRTGSDFRGKQKLHQRSRGLPNSKSTNANLRYSGL